MTGYVDSIQPYSQHQQQLSQQQLIQQQLTQQQLTQQQQLIQQQLTQQQMLQQQQMPQHVPLQQLTQNIHAMQQITNQPLQMQQEPHLQQYAFPIGQMSKVNKKQLGNNLKTAGNERIMKTDIEKMKKDIHDIKGQLNIQNESLEKYKNNAKNTNQTLTCDTYPNDIKDKLNKYDTLLNLQKENYNALQVNYSALKSESDLRANEYNEHKIAYAKFKEEQNKKILFRRKHEAEVDKNLEIINKRISTLEEIFNKEIALLKTMYQQEKSTKLLQMEQNIQKILTKIENFHNEYFNKMEQNGQNTEQNRQNIEQIKQNIEQFKQITDSLKNDIAENMQSCNNQESLYRETKCLIDEVDKKINKIIEKEKININNASNKIQFNVQKNISSEINTKRKLTNVNVKSMPKNKKQRINLKPGNKNRPDMNNDPSLKQKKVFKKHNYDNLTDSQKDLMKNK